MVSHPPEYKPAVTIFTTQRCNYRCIMCFWGKPEVARELQRDDRTMDMPLYNRVLEEITPYCSSISLTSNGEFLMDSLFKERIPPLVATLRRNPAIKFFPISNASLLTREKIKLFEGIPQIGFTISIDTVDPLEYASIRRPGVLSGVLENIRDLRGNLSEIGVDDVHIQLNMVIMKRNTFSVPQALHFAKDIHATLFVDHPQGWGPENLRNESLFGVPVFANNFLGMCRDLAEKLNVAFDAPPPFAILPEEIEQYYDSKTQRNTSCAQLNQNGPVLIAANGEVGICCQNIIFGNLNEQSFKDIFFSPRFDEYRAAIAEGDPLPPCDQCRWLQRTSPYLYESGDYELDIPPESRNFDPEPDFSGNGFVEWLDDFSEKQLRSRLRQAYAARGKRLLHSELREELDALQRNEDMTNQMVELIQNHAKVVVYPAGGQAAWMLKHTILPKLNILGFSDRNPDLQGQTFHGFNVVSPEAITDLKPDIVIVASDLYKKQIFRDLAYLEDSGIRLISV